MSNQPIPEPRGEPFFGRRKTMIYIEELLAPGDALYAVGSSRRDPGPPVSDGTGVAPSSQLVLYADPGARGELILTTKRKSNWCRVS